PRGPLLSPLFPYTTLFRSGCAPSETLLQAFDKSRVIARAATCGVAVPPTEFPDSLADCHAAADRVGFPCVVKARRSSVLTAAGLDRKSTRLNSSHQIISYA